MFATVLSSAVVGIDAHPVEVEVDIANGLPGFNIVGLPDTACRESADRVRAAIKNSGFGFPAKKITVNLAPADLKKEGSAYDLAIAVGILAAAEVLETSQFAGKYFCGELSLEGKVRGVPGILPRAVALLTLPPDRREFFVPAENLKEALCASGVAAYPVRTLSQLVQHLLGKTPMRAAQGCVEAASPKQTVDTRLDFAVIKGQAHAKRGLEIAAAGGHNVLMIGPPGSGKTMLAKTIPSILSSLSFEEAVEATKIHSVAGLLSSRSALLASRPFRSPHHTISDVAMVGGGAHPKPGEVSLAHQGVLFLDEFAEFRRNVLEVLRQPLEEGKVTISRAVSTLTLPARFMLVAAMNPCPCGHYTDPKKECTCSSIQIKNYLSKVSGPLLDRIDIQLEVPCLKVGEITHKVSAEPSSAIRARVEKAKSAQRSRYREHRIASNSELEVKQIEVHCRVSTEGEKLLSMAVQELGFSARAYHKCLKVARTIADLDGKDEIASDHVAEAIHYRTLDRYLNGV